MNLGQDKCENKVDAVLHTNVPYLPACTQLIYLSTIIPTVPLSGIEWRGRKKNKQNTTASEKKEYYNKNTTIHVHINMMARKEYASL